MVKEDAKHSTCLHHDHHHHHCHHHLHQHQHRHVPKKSHISKFRNSQILRLWTSDLAENITCMIRETYLQ